MATSYSLNTPYIVLGGVLIIGVVAVFAVFRPQISTLRQLREDTQAQELVVQEKEQFLRTIDQKKAQLAAVAEQNRTLAVMLPAEESFEDVVRIFHVAAQVAGGRVTSVTNRSSEEEGKINAQRARGERVALPASIIPQAAEVDFTGAYQQLRVFFDQLQRSPRLMDIHSFSITTDAAQPGIVSADVFVRFYQQGKDSHALDE